MRLGERRLNSILFVAQGSSGYAPSDISSHDTAGQRSRPEATDFRSE